MVGPCFLLALVSDPTNNFLSPNAHKERREEFTPEKIPNPTMARSKSSDTDSKAQSTATIGFEAKLWLTADKLRNNMDTAEYKHVVVGLIFLKYISDTFDFRREQPAKTPPSRPTSRSAFTPQYCR